MTDATREGNGFVDWDLGRTAYRVAGRSAPGGPAPLVVLHGGPGVPHDYLEGLGELAERGRAVVFYDQLGCGRSPAPVPGPRWSLDLFLRELDAVVRHLGFPRYHVLGQSWGGILALEHAMRRPSGLAGLVLASAPASMPLFAREVARLRAGLPDDVQAVLARHEAAGTLEAPEYQEATMAFYRRHVCRLDPWPEPLMRSFGGLSAEVYGALWGASEFLVRGSLKDWDPTPRLARIEVPSLVLSGRHDEVTPVHGERLAAALGAKRVVFEASAHLPHLEEPDRFLETVSAFLGEADAAAKR